MRTVLPTIFYLNPNQVSLVRVNLAASKCDGIEDRAVSEDIPVTVKVKVKVKVEAIGVRG